MATAKRTSKTAKKPAKKVIMKAKVRKVADKKQSTTKMKPVKLLKITPPKKPFTSGEFLSVLSESSNVSKKEVKLVLEKMKEILGAHIGKNGPGSAIIPGLMKVTIKVKPATKARKGINPFTGEEMMFKAKPASRVIRIKALKKLKELV